MRVRRRSAWVLSVLVGSACVALIAGSAAAGEPLTRKAFQKQANDLCRTGNIAIGQVFNDTFKGVEAGKELPPELIAVAADAAVPILRDTLDRVEDLDGPAAFEQRVDKMLGQYRAVADDIEDDPELILSEDDLFVKPDIVAKRLGLRRCVQEPG
jgi:hypothetical protein